MPRTFKARPTTDFAKENIFNVMMGYIDFEGSTALDLFAGTGSITLELLSRGCDEVVSVEMDRDHARFIQQCIDKLATLNHTLIKGDAFRFLKSCKRRFDFIFTDPYTLLSMKRGCCEKLFCLPCSNTIMPSSASNGRARSGIVSILGRE